MSKQQELDTMIRSIAESGDKLPAPERRSFLKNGLAMLGAAGAIAGAGRLAHSWRLP